MKLRRRLCLAFVSPLALGAVVISVLSGCSPSPSKDTAAEVPPPADGGAATAATAGGSGDSASESVSEGLAAVVPENLVDAQGNAVDRGRLADKLVGLYFSAHWCPPCKKFTPKLVDFRDRHADDFEVVFVSSDRDEQAQLRYMETYDMKWPAVKYGPALQELAQRFGVRGIPTLIVLSPDGDVITQQGRRDVMTRPSEALTEWKDRARS